MNKLKASISRTKIFNNIPAVEQKCSMRSRWKRNTRSCSGEIFWSCLCWRHIMTHKHLCCKRYLSHTERQPFSPIGNLELSVNLTPRLWTLGGSRSTWREPAQTWREHANLTQKSPGQMVDSNSGPACCEGAVLTTAATCCPDLYQLHYIPLSHISLGYSICDPFICRMLVLSLQCDFICTSCKAPCDVYLPNCNFFSPPFFFFTLSKT